MQFTWLSERKIVIVCSSFAAFFALAFVQYDPVMHFYLLLFY